MKINWKRILAIAAAVIVAVLIVVYIVVASYDYNQLKPQIAAAVKDHTGRELTLAGDIELKIGLFPKVAVSDVAFQNADWGSRPQMVTIEGVEVQMALLPLIIGNVKVRRFSLLKPDILIEVNRSGRNCRPVCFRFGRRTKPI